MSRQSAILVRFSGEPVGDGTPSLPFETEDVPKNTGIFTFDRYVQTRLTKSVRLIASALVILGILGVALYQSNYRPYSLRIPLIRSESSIGPLEEFAASLLGSLETTTTEPASTAPLEAPPEQKLHGMIEDTPEKAPALTGPAPSALLQVEPGAGLKNADGVMVFGTPPAPSEAKSKLANSQTLKRGTFVPAILETPIEPDTPSGVRALVPVDVKGHRNSATLPKSSRLVGQYYTKESEGRDRVFIIWKQLILPDGSVRTLDSGSIAKDNFFSSFGSASMISVVEAEGKSGSLNRVRTGEALRVITARDVGLASSSNAPE